MPVWDNNGMVREEMRRQGLKGSLWEDIFLQHCIALGALVAGKPTDAYSQLVAYTQPFLKVSSSSGICSQTAPKKHP